MIRKHVPPSQTLPVGDLAKEARALERLERQYRRKVILVLLMMAAGLVAMFLIAGPARAETTVYCTAESYLNCRWSPDRDSEVVYKLYPGDSAVMVALDGSWAKLVIAGDECWASIDYLTDRPPDAPSQMATVTGGRLALRVGPDGKRLGWLEKGQEVTVKGWLDGWARVDDGWVKAEHLEVRE